MTRFFAMILVLLFSFTGCVSTADSLNHDTVQTETAQNSIVQTEETTVDLPDSFSNILSEENLLEVPERSGLDRIVDDALDIIGVEKIEYMAYGNFMDLANLGVQLDVFIIADTDRMLTANVIFMNHSNEWSITFISDAKDNKYYYVPSDASATVDIYDYSTGKLVSTQSMTHEEFSEEIKKQQEESDKKFQENLNEILEEFGVDTETESTTNTNYKSTIRYEFQNCEMDIPKNWSVYQQDEEFVTWLPEQDSDVEYAQISIMVLGRWGYSKESIHNEELQANIQNEVNNVFLSEIHNTRVVSSILEKTEKEYYHYAVTGLYHGGSQETKITFSTYSFVIGDKLFLVIYQSSDEDTYDYTSNVISMINSVDPILEMIHVVDDPTVEETSIDLPNSSTSDINVHFISDTIDNDRLHLKVYTKNNSEEVFSGHVYVSFYSADGEDYLGSDTIFVDDLQPGQESWANVTIDAYRSTPKMAVDFSEVTFTPLEEIISEVDSEVSKKVSQSYELNFDGVSWYKDITKIEVYSDGNCVVTIKDNAKNGGQFYANVIKQCGEQHGVTTVKVIDINGNVKAVF